jgi:hypothetical protein
VPAAAVIPAPRAYIKFVAVKASVVETSPRAVVLYYQFTAFGHEMSSQMLLLVTLSKLECSNQISV